MKYYTMSQDISEAYKWGQPCVQEIDLFSLLVCNQIKKFGID